MVTVEYKKSDTILQIDNPKEEEKIADRIASSIDDHNRIVKIDKKTSLMKRGIEFLVRAEIRRGDEEHPDDEGYSRTEHIQLTGKRLLQFQMVCTLWKQRPDLELYAVCCEVFAKTSGGYPTARSLHRFCLTHPFECHR